MPDSAELYLMLSLFENPKMDSGALSCVQNPFRVCTNNMPENKPPHLARARVRDVALLLAERHRVFRLRHFLFLGTELQGLPAYCWVQQI